MLKMVRERLTLVLVALLPFHALLVTVGTKMIEGPGNAPLGWLALWKEAVLGVVLVITFWEILRSYPPGQRPDRTGKFQVTSFRFDKLDALIVSLIGLSFILFTYHLPLTTSSYLFGFKYDFVPLVAFIILRRVEWSKDFLNKLPVVIIGVGALVAAYSIATFFLPMGWFTALGYSDLHSLYIPDGPLAAFQQIGGSALRRVQGPMSGPNQLGIWLLIPLGLLVSGFRFQVSGSRKALILTTYLLLLTSLVLTFSRSAWIAATIIVLIALWQGVEQHRRAKIFSWIASGVAVIAIIAGLFFPSILLRIASSRGHIEKPLQAIVTMIENPLGLGLGSAGPASNRMSDACVHLESGADASWATAHPDLCVFVGDTQVQPVNEECNCPFVTENWYLQIGVELGVLGFVLYLVLIGFVLKGLNVSGFRFQVERLSKVQPVTCNMQPYLPFIAVCIAGLFLHSFEDAAVAYTVWVLVSISVKKT